MGELGSKLLTHFMATTRMYFLLLTCEVKCDAAALDVADRQNAHSTMVAVRAFVRLFRFVKREKELDRKILAFSILHDHRQCRRAPGVVFRRDAKRTKKLWDKVWQ